MTQTDLRPTCSDPVCAPIPNALTVANLTFAYPGQPRTLQDVSLQIADGERVGIIGHNGCGKTTLFTLMCGVLRPDAGEIFLFGEPVRAGHFHPGVGLLFQSPNDQLFSHRCGMMSPLAHRIWACRPKRWPSECKRR